MGRWNNLKRCFREVKSGLLSISTPKEFADAAQKFVPSIDPLYLSVRGGIHTHFATRNVIVTLVGVWVFCHDVVCVAI